jgi:hypothetical protein
MKEDPAMPVVLNAKKVGRHQEGAVYIGRPSKWGNPFVIGEDGDRSEVIRKYEDLVMSTKRFCEEIKRDLRGKDLICWCHPSPCHGDVLIRIANEEI